MKQLIIFLPVLLLSCSHFNKSYKYGSDMIMLELEIKYSSVQYLADKKILKLQGELFDKFDSRSLYELGYYDDSYIYFLVGKYQGKKSKWVTERIDSSNTRYFSFSDTVSENKVLKIRGMLYEDLDINLAEMVETVAE